jgi:hypothetical protein
MVQQLRELKKIQAAHQEEQVRRERDEEREKKGERKREEEGQKRRESAKDFFSLF